MKLARFNDYLGRLDRVSSLLLETSLQQEMDLRSLGLSTVGWSVEYDVDTDYIEDADFGFANSWGEGHLFIRSVEGEFTTYVTNIETVLSDGTRIWVDCYYSPASTGRDHAKLSIEAPGGRAKEVDLMEGRSGSYSRTGVQDLWMRELEKYGSGIKAIINLWKRFR